MDENGWEQDEYDALNPLYIIWEDADGRHGGSMRVLPTTGRTMAAEHFLDLTGGVRIVEPADLGVHALLPGAGRLAGGRRRAAARRRSSSACASALDAGGRGVRRADAADLRPHRHSPDVIGTSGEGRDAISVGLWPITEEARARSRAGPASRWR